MCRHEKCICNQIMRLSLIAVTLAFSTLAFAQSAPSSGGKQMSAGAKDLDAAQHLAHKSQARLGMTDGKGDKGGGWSREAVGAADRNMVALVEKLPNGTASCCRPEHFL